MVLNLVINGLPSILVDSDKDMPDVYKNYVLNLVINGLPSILISEMFLNDGIGVLNLVINGLPSILTLMLLKKNIKKGFKPCYKWITFNTP